MSSDTVASEIKGFHYQRRRLRPVSHYGPVIRRFQRRWLRGRSGVFGRPTLEHQYDASRKRHDLWILWDWIEEVADADDIKFSSLSQGRIKMEDWGQC